MAMKIQKFYAIVDIDGNVFDEYVDRKEANYYFHTYRMGDDGYNILACAAEIINDNGDLDETFCANTMAEAVRKLKASA